MSFLVDWRRERSWPFRWRLIVESVKHKLRHPFTPLPTFLSAQSVAREFAGLLKPRTAVWRGRESKP